MVEKNKEEVFIFKLNLFRTFYIILIRSKNFYTLSNNKIKVNILIINNLFLDFRTRKIKFGLIQ